MVIKETARVGDKVAIPTRKTARVSIDHLTAELAGCRLEWDRDKQMFIQVGKERRGQLWQPYRLPYLLVASVGTFADTKTMCVNLKRADGVSYLGAHLFAPEDLDLYKAPQP